MDQQKLPNATGVLVLGIVSIVGCCCYALPGLITGIIAIVLYNKDKKLYDSNPGLYSDYGNLNAGRILAIIGIVLSVLYIITILIMGSVIGWEAMFDQELLKERLEELKNR